jgi:hypothetical protein
MSIRQPAWWVVALCLVLGAPTGFVLAQSTDQLSFSSWIQASGFSYIEYRWRLNAERGCDVEYRNAHDRRLRTYKTRIVFQTSGEEHHLENAVLSFEDGIPVSSDHVSVCSGITDITVTHF